MRTQIAAPPRASCAVAPLHCSPCRGSKQALGSTPFVAHRLRPERGDREVLAARLALEKIITVISPRIKSVRFRRALSLPFSHAPAAPWQVASVATSQPTSSSKGPPRTSHRPHQAALRISSAESRWLRRQRAPLAAPLLRQSERLLWSNSRPVPRRQRRWRRRGSTPRWVGRMGAPRDRAGRCVAATRPLNSPPPAPRPPCSSLCWTLAGHSGRRQRRHLVRAGARHPRWGGTRRRRARHRPGRPALRPRMAPRSARGAFARARLRTLCMRPRGCALEPRGSSGCLRVGSAGPSGGPRTCWDL